MAGIELAKWLVGNVDLHIWASLDEHLLYTFQDTSLRILKVAIKKAFWTFYVYILTRETFDHYHTINLSEQSIVSTEKNKKIPRRFFKELDVKQLVVSKLDNPNG